MKTKTILIVLAFLAVTSCMCIHGARKPHRIEPNPVITTNWSQKKYKGLGDRYQDDYMSRDTINCVTTCIVEKDYYRFYVYSTSDTVEILVHKMYIGNNVDTISIHIDKAADSSEIGVHPDCSWVRLGCTKQLLGGFYSDYCEVYSTSPVFVNVHLIVNPMVDNVNPSYRKLLKSRVEIISDSISKCLDSIIQSIELD